MIKLKTKISSFFIFNSTLGPKEGEELKRILFFHPPNVDDDERKMQVGLCEAVVKFMVTFSSEPCEAMNTQTKRYIFYQPEPNFWIVMVVRVPSSVNTTNSEYHPDEIQPKVFQNVLKSAYKMFKLFIGPLSSISIDQIYEKCENFFKPYLSKCDITDNTAEIIPGISYIKLEKQSFFKVMSFIDQIEIKFPDIKCALLLCNDQVVWNDINCSEAITMYKYLVDTVLAEEVVREIQGGAVAAAETHGRFISPVKGIKEPEDLNHIPVVWLMDETAQQLERYYFVIYRAFSVTVCFVIHGSKTITLEKYLELDTFVGAQLSSIALSIAENCLSPAVSNTATSDPQYIYFNRINMELRTNMISNKLSTSMCVQSDVLNIIADIHSDRKSLGNYGEVIIKTPDEHWITGKSSNEREFYVVIQQKGANLKGISDEVKKVCDAQLKGIFFYPV